MTVIRVSALVTPMPMSALGIAKLAGRRPSEPPTPCSDPHCLMLTSSVAGVYRCGGNPGLGAQVTLAACCGAGMTVGDVLRLMRCARGCYGVWRRLRA
jgi:hypothetical protein